MAGGYSWSFGERPYRTRAQGPAMGPRPVKPVRDSSFLHTPARRDRRKPENAAQRIEHAMNIRVRAKIAANLREGRARRRKSEGGGGDVQVAGYERDGHQVSGYTRSRPTR